MSLQATRNIVRTMRRRAPVPQHTCTVSLFSTKPYPKNILPTNLISLRIPKLRPYSSCAERTPYDSSRHKPCHHQNARSSTSPPCGVGAAAAAGTTTPAPRINSPAFWSSRQVWARSGVNTLRCLAGCTSGDFAAMWALQSWYPDMGMSVVMAISMACGISTSMLLETVLLRAGRDKLAWPIAFKTAAGMSLISMVTMELAENSVDWYLTGGQVDIASPNFWLAAFVSMTAGFLAPLPYNYIRLRKFGKACH